MARLPSGAPSDARHDWLRPPERPVRYGPLQRFADWYNALLDGHKKFPAVPPRPDPEHPQPAEQPEDTEQPESAGPVTGPQRRPVWTPYIELLSRWTAGRIQAEYIRLQRRTHTLERDLEHARIAVERHEQRVAVSESRVKDAPLPFTEERLGSRRQVEVDRDRPEHLSRSRRATEHARAVAAAEAHRTRAQDDADAADSHLVMVRARLTAERRAAGARARRLDEHCRRRIASYWRHLVRHHPGAHELIASMEPAGPTLPAWAREEPETDEE